MKGDVLAQALLVLANVHVGSSLLVKPHASSAGAAFVQPALAKIDAELRPPCFQRGLRPPTSGNAREKRGLVPAAAGLRGCQPSECAQQRASLHAAWNRFKDFLRAVFVHALVLVTFFLFDPAKAKAGVFYHTASTSTTGPAVVYMSDWNDWGAGEAGEDDAGKESIPQPHLTPGYERKDVGIHRLPSLAGEPATTAQFDEARPQAQQTYASNTDQDQMGWDNLDTPNSAMPENRPTKEDLATTSYKIHPAVAKAREEHARQEEQSRQGQGQGRTGFGQIGEKVGGFVSNIFNHQRSSSPKESPPAPPPRVAEAGRSGPLPMKVLRVSSSLPEQPGEDGKTAGDSTGRTAPSTSQQGEGEQDESICHHYRLRYRCLECSDPVSAPAALDYSDPVAAPAAQQPQQPQQSQQQSEPPQAQPEPKPELKLHPPQLDPHMTEAYSRGITGGDYQLVTANPFPVVGNTPPPCDDISSPCASPAPDEDEAAIGKHALLTGELGRGELGPSAECDSDIRGLEPYSEAVRFLEVSQYKDDSEVFEKEEARAPGADPHEASQGLVALVLKIAVGVTATYISSPDVRAAVDPALNLMGQSAVVAGSAVGKGLSVSAKFVGEHALLPLGKTVGEKSMVTGKYVGSTAVVVGKTMGDKASSAAGYVGKTVAEKSLSVGKSVGRTMGETLSSAGMYVGKTVSETLERVKLGTIGETPTKRIGEVTVAQETGPAKYQLYTYAGDDAWGSASKPCHPSVERDGVCRAYVRSTWCGLDRVASIFVAGVAATCLAAGTYMASGAPGAAGQRAKMASWIEATSSMYDVMRKAVGWQATAPSAARKGEEGKGDVDGVDAEKDSGGGKRDSEGTAVEAEVVRADEQRDKRLRMVFNEDNQGKDSR